jgi:L-threonylcarbamoyladenylate synthase
MTARVILSNGSLSEQAKIKEIVDILRSGGIAGIPTETVFGLACNKNDENAVKRLYEIKNRPFDKSLVIQIAHIDKLLDYQPNLTEEIESIADRFWPGPLTIVLNTKYGKEGFRIPDNKTALSIIEKSDFPVAVTSANISGEKDLFSAEEVKNVFGDKIDIIIDDGTRAGGIASTVVDCTQIPFKILRKGMLAEELYRFMQIKGSMA